MVNLGAIALGNQVLFGYDLPFKGHIPQEFSFSCLFETFEWEDKLHQIKRGKPAVIDGPYCKIQVSKNGPLYDIQIIPYLPPRIIKSGNPYKDLKI